jgi:hypothetical protein
MDLNITSTVAEKAIDSVRSFLAKLIGPATTELGESMGDHVKWWRTRRQLDLLEKVKDYTERNNVPLRQIGVKTLLPLLEHSSLEEEPLLQERWETLLIHCIDARRPQAQSIFPFILSQISSKEAQALIGLRGMTIKINWFNSITEQLGIDEIEFSNLKRLGVIEEWPDYKGRAHEREYGEQRVDVDAQGSSIGLTALGVAFLDAVEHGPEEVRGT